MRTIRHTLRPNRGTPSDSPKLKTRNSPKGLGQSIAEFALTAPLLLLLLFAIVDTARLIQAQVTVNNAARQAVRFGVTGDQERDLVNGGYKLREVSIREKAIAGLNGLPLTNTIFREEFGWHTVNITPPSPKPRSFLQVEVWYNVDILTPLMNAILPRVTVRGSEMAITEEWGAVQSFDRANIPPFPPPLPTWTPVPTRTPTPPATPTRTVTRTATITRTATPPPTPLATFTPTIPLTTTATSTVTRTIVATATVTPTPRGRLRMPEFRARLERDNDQRDYRKMDIRARVQDPRNLDVSDATVNVTVVRVTTNPNQVIWSGTLPRIGVQPGVYLQCNAGTFPSSTLSDYKVTIVASHPDFDPVTVTLAPSSGDATGCN